MKSKRFLAILLIGAILFGNTTSVSASSMSGFDKEVGGYNITDSVGWEEELQPVKTEDISETFGEYVKQDEENEEYIKEQTETPVEETAETEETEEPALEETAEAAEAEGTEEPTQGETVEAEETEEPTQEETAETETEETAREETAEAETEETAQEETAETETEGLTQEETTETEETEEETTEEIQLVSENNIVLTDPVFSEESTPLPEKEIYYASGTTVAGALIEKRAFTRWADAIAYLNTAGKKAECIIEIAEETETCEKFILPSNADTVLIKGIDEDGEKMFFSYLGDISLSASTTIENVILSAQKYNSKTKNYEDYTSAVKLNGKELSFINSEAEFASVTGDAKATLTLTDSDILVEKAVSSLGYLNIYDSVFSANSVAVTGKLQMLNAVMESVSKITLNHIVSKSQNNILIYDGSTAEKGLNIKGYIEAPEDVNEPITVLRDENGVSIEKQTIIRKNAITLQPRFMEKNGYKSGTVVCNAVKAGASWFVIGSEWETSADANVRVSIAYGTHKIGKNILCGETVENVNLYSSKTENGNYILEGGFETLQNALSEIDRISVKENYYRVELMKADKEVVTFSGKTLTFPSKTAGLTVTADKSVEGVLAEPIIYFKGNLVIKADTVFDEIVFVPTAKAKITLGNYRLTLSKCRVQTNNSAAGFSQIEGSGTGKRSELVLDDTVLRVSGSVSGVGNLKYAGEARPRLLADGAVNVGNIHMSTDAELTGLATVTRKKSGSTKTVTQVATKITIAGNVFSENNSRLYLDLCEKVGKECRQLDFDTSDMDAIEKKGILMAKALRVTYPNIKALQWENQTGLIKSAGYLTQYSGEYGAKVEYLANGDKIEIPCLTIGDAVTEINNQRTKRDYIITLTKEMDEISGATQNDGSFVPKALKMPSSKYVSSLVLQGKWGEERVKLGYLDNITFTCPTTLCDVDFTRMLKVKNTYQTADKAKKNYPAITTVNTGGHALEIEGIVTFNTPITLNGKEKGVLTLDSEGTLATLTNQFDGPVATEENVIYGMITGFQQVNVNGCNLVLKEYRSSASSLSYKASANKVANLNIIDGNVVINGEKTKGSLTVSGKTCIDSGELSVGGKVSLKHVEMEGVQSPTIQADYDFIINGNLTSISDNATLLTRLKGKGKAPYLNIKGKVICEDSAPIYVGVYPDNTSKKKDDRPVKLVNAPKVTGQLLTAEKASATVFRPIPENTSGYGPYDSTTNPKGYWVGKVKSNIYVYEGKKE